MAIYNHMSELQNDPLRKPSKIHQKHEFMDRSEQQKMHSSMRFMNDNFVNYVRLVVREMVDLMISFDLYDTF